MADNPLRPASFNNVPFLVRDLSIGIGRRNVLHEFPGRDIPDGEDLGRAAREFSVTAFFFGDSASDEADILIDELESTSKGLLVHPYRGTQLVQLQGKAKVRYPAAQGGVISIDMQFIEAGQTPDPAVSADSDAQLAAAADDAQAAADAELESSWLDETANLAEEAAQAVTGVLTTFEGYMKVADAAMSKIDRIINAVQSIINTPLVMLAGIKSRLSNLIGKLSNPFSGLTAWKQLLSSEALNPWKNPISFTGKSSSSSAVRPAWTTPNPALATGQLPAMPPSLAAYVRRTLIIEGARAISTSSFTTKGDVAQAQTLLMTALDAEIKVASDAVYPALQNLRVALAQSITARIASAADLQIISTQDTLPALVLAYIATGDVSTTDDLVARNGVKHPGFVPAGNIEVLKDG